MRARKYLSLLAFDRLAGIPDQTQLLVQNLNTFAVLPWVWGSGVVWIACRIVHGCHRRGPRRHQLLGLFWVADRRIN